MALALALLLVVVGGCYVCGSSRRKESRETFEISKIYKISNPLRHVSIIYNSYKAKLHIIPH